MDVTRKENLKTGKESWKKLRKIRDNQPLGKPGEAWKKRAVSPFYFYQLELDDSYFIRIRLFPVTERVATIGSVISSRVRGEVNDEMNATRSKKEKKDARFSRAAMKRFSDECAGPFIKVNARNYRRSRTSDDLSQFGF